MPVGQRTTLSELPLKPFIESDDDFWIAGQYRQKISALQEKINEPVLPRLDSLEIFDSDLLNNITPTKGTALVGHRGRYAKDWLDEFPHIDDFGDIGGGDDKPVFEAAAAESRLTFISRRPGGYAVSSSFGPSTGAWLPDPSQTWDELTESGQIDLLRGFQTNVGPANPNGGNIWRLADRVFIGEAASKFAGAALSAPDAGTSWLSNNANSAAFTGINAQLLVTTNTGKYAITGASKNSLNIAGGTQCIGVSGVVINDVASGNAWGLYSDLQHEAGSNLTLGLEVAAKNKGASATKTPYQTAGGVFGIWLAGGGDNAYGGAAANPSNSAIAIIYNSHSWNRGIVFTANAITGTDGSAGSATNAIAIEMGRRQMIQWADPTSGLEGAGIVSLVTTNASRVRQQFEDNLMSLYGANNNRIAAFNHAASAVNYLSVTNAAAAAGPLVQAVGADTDVDLRLAGKGAGVLRYGTFTSNADAPVNGYITIKDAAGNIRKLATIA